MPALWRYAGVVQVTVGTGGVVVPGWLQVPVGAGADVWSTYVGARTVLAVAHSVASTARLLDVLTVVAADPRVQVLFTPIPGSAFDDGVEPFLADVGARIIPWEQAIEQEFSLAVAAGNSGDLHCLHAPVMVMPHGMGYNKYLKRKTKNEKRKTVYGLAAEQLLHDGRLVPAAIVLSHGEQLARLRRSCPAAVPFAVVAGDPCLDRMAASLPWRDRYRSALGVPPGGRLVVISSTWGRASLLGRHPELPARVLAALPADGYRVALVAHPNIWHGHGAWQMRSWLADCRRAGLLLIPPREGWRAAVVAADCVLGDHGSVTLYAAAVGRPTVLAAYDGADIDPGTAMAELPGLVPHLAPDARIREQLEGAVAGHDPGLARKVADMAVARRGESAAVLRALMYDLMGLSEPATPVHIPPVPPATAEPPAWEHGARPALTVTAQPAVTGTGTSTDIGGSTGTGTTDGRANSGGSGSGPDAGTRRDVGSGPRARPSVRIERFPAVLGGAAARGPSHLVVDDTEPDERLRQLADLLVRRPDEPGPAAAAPPAQVLAAYPACRAVADANPGHCVLHLRTGSSFSIIPEAPLPPALDTAIFASALLAVLPPVQPPPPAPPAGLTLHLASHRIPLIITPHPPPPPRRS